MGQRKNEEWGKYQHTISRMDLADPLFPKKLIFVLTILALKFFPGKYAFNLCAISLSRSVFL
jgi:hypothetical protein